jgi:hypothetical protein
MAYDYQSQSSMSLEGKKQDYWQIKFRWRTTQILPHHPKSKQILQHFDFKLLTFKPMRE